MLKMIDNKDFLVLTCKNENHLEAFSFLLPNGTQVDIWDTGIIAFTPEHAIGSGRDIVLSCGVHGNETAPVEILNELVQQLLRQECCVADRTLFIFGNPSAINAGSRFVKENMNRLFSGAYAEGGVVNKERERAAKLEMYITRFFGQGGRFGVRERFHYDLHTAIRGSKHEKFAIYPCLHGKPWVKSQLNFLVDCGVSAVLLYDQPTTTFSYFSANNFQAHAFTIELGKVRTFGENNPDHFVKVRRKLFELVTATDKSQITHLHPKLKIFKTCKTVNRMTENFCFTFDDLVENFTEFPVNTVLGYDGGVSFKSDVDGEAVVFPNAYVAKGQRALLTVAPYIFSEDELI